MLALTDDIDTYRPRSKETRAAYEDLLSLVSRQLGDQPHDILRGAADEVIACLKTDTLSDPERKKEVEKLINSLSTETFAQFVQCGKRITDYAVDDGAGNEKLDDELGVAVVFDEDDDDDPDVQDGRNDDDDAIVAEDISDEEDGGGAPIFFPCAQTRKLFTLNGMPTLLSHTGGTQDASLGGARGACFVVARALSCFPSIMLSLTTHIAWLPGTRRCRHRGCGSTQTCSRRG